jgi:hypothetical protein
MYPSSWFQYPLSSLIFLQCEHTRTSYITGTIDHHERLSFVQKQVGHKTTQMIIKHYYKHIPASDDGKAFEKAFAETVAMKNLTSGDTK